MKRNLGNVQNYGTARVSVNRDGVMVIRLPRKFVAALRLKVGDTVMISRRKTGCIYLRFYRKHRGRWRILLLGGKSRVVRRPR